MRKIPTLFRRDWEGDPRYVTREVNPECAWVIAGEGAASRKYDGTCVMFDGQDWWARREVKTGKDAPPGFVSLGTDEETGKMIGWEPIGQSAFARWHADALGHPALKEDLAPGTFELLGPKVNGNPEKFEAHYLLRHVFAQRLPDAPRDFGGLAAWLDAHEFEGVVWHHPDGRMAKIKKRDFPGPAPVLYSDP